MTYSADYLLDQWLEEDTPIYVHPKSPFKRVDLLASSRHIKITLPSQGEDVILADTPHAIHLHETDMPPRFYLPLTATTLSLLRPSKSGLKTQCPYKGEAEYYDVVLPDGSVGENLVWYYTRPTNECAGIAGMVCFYNEKVDIWIEGAKQERSKTIFS